MTSKSKPRLCLSDPPLVLVLVQARFSAVLSIADFVPRIQEAFRKTGYPRFTSEQVEQIHLGQAPKTSTVTRWLFGSADGDANVVLTDSFVVYEVSRYSSFEEFSAAFKQTTQVIADVVAVALVESLGLRYVNYVRPTPDLGISDLVSGQMCGLTREQLGVKAVLQQHTIRAATDEGRMDVRLVESPQGSFLPADLSESHVLFDEELKESSGWILDLDHRSASKFEFEPTMIDRRVQALHETIERAFLAIVTPAALASWGERRSSE